VLGGKARELGYDANKEIKLGRSCGILKKVQQRQNVDRSH
jgi:hypothetical protein